MSREKPTPTGRESPLGDDELIVTKTDTRGRLTYANEVFLRVSHLDGKGVLGQPHSIIRHPDMPRCVFELLWKTISAGEEFFGYVLNLATNGDHYWVFAHVTPSRAVDGTITGYHSNRRKPEPRHVAAISAIYRDLAAAERAEADRKAGQRRGGEELASLLHARNSTYERFVFSI